MKVLLLKPQIMPYRLTLTTPLSELGRVGKKTARLLKKLDLQTAEDLLFYFPFRYDDFSKILTVTQLKSGQKGTIRVRIDLIANKRSPVKKKLLTEALVSDSSGSMKVIWFNQPYLTRVLRPGQHVLLAGSSSLDWFGLELVNPSYEVIYKGKLPLHTARLVPVYPTTGRLTQKQIRWLVKQVLPLASLVKDWIPKDLKRELSLPDLGQALWRIHFPTSNSQLERAQHRLKFDELFLIQLRSQILRQNLKKLKAPQIPFQEQATKKFVNSLGFKLTNAQRKSAWGILKDLEQPHPMNRLLEGDVGSGKTVVAAIAMLNTVLADYQVVFMAPTEILAGQHFTTLTKLFKNLDIKIGLLTRSRKKIKIKKTINTKKEKLIKKITDGQIDIIIGTHALLQENIRFNKLGLAIVDEQHRFGVEQRAKLTQHSGLKNLHCPHSLSMTATPIPRSLNLTLYGDLDLTIIDEMPKGRKNIKTKIIEPKQEQATYQFIREEIKAGRQAFVICPLIDPSDKLGVKSVKEEYEKLVKIFTNLKIALLHGRLKSTVKEKIMEDFLKNKINILISTTVVEVGIDVPNASIMLIEGAERFGLAQLYQLRGRVGRSHYQSHCFLFAENQSKKVEQRLKALLTVKNGFELAEKDLELRGPGQIYGTTQSGYLDSLKIARLTDYKIIQETQEWVKKIIDQDPELKKFPLLRGKISQFFKTIHLE
jgi:ATP-dependent DNA helicase RecG